MNYFFRDKVFVCFGYMRIICRIVYCFLVHCIMIKNEQSRQMNQYTRTTPTTSLPPPLLQLPLPAQASMSMAQPTSGILSQRLIDSNAIDTTSLKGQFAWEKIVHSDTYIPVLFRYVIVGMHRNLTSLHMTFSPMASQSLSEKKKKCVVPDI